MCDLCSQDEEVYNKEIKRILFYAEQMEELSYLYKQMAYGQIKPHSDRSKQVELSAKEVIRELVERWV